MKKAGLIVGLVIVFALVALVVRCELTSRGIGVGVLDVSHHIDTWEFELHVDVRPNVNTVPSRAYEVDVFFDGELLGSRMVCFRDTSPSTPFDFPLPNHVELTWGIVPGNPMYDVYEEDLSKPLKDRRNLNRGVRVEVTDTGSVGGNCHG